LLHFIYFNIFFIESSGQKRQQRVSTKENLRLDRLFAMLVCADYQPFSMSDSVAFRNFVRALNQSWTPPSRTAVSECLVPALAKEIEERLIDLLKKVDDISLTTDAWTSKGPTGGRGCARPVVANRTNFRILSCVCSV
jgi:hypothetical protein